VYLRHHVDVNTWVNRPGDVSLSEHLGTQVVFARLSAPFGIERFRVSNLKARSHHVLFAGRTRPGLADKKLAACPG